MDHIKALQSIGKVKQFQKGTYIFYEGDESDYLYILLKGSVAIERSSFLKGEIIELAQLGEGKVLGEMALISKEKRSASARTLTDVIALAIDDSHLEDFIGMAPKYAIGLMENLALRYQEIKSKVED